jgi:hypothetical protein
MDWDKIEQRCENLMVRLTPPRLIIWVVVMLAIAWGTLIWEAVKLFLL